MGNGIVTFLGSGVTPEDPGELPKNVAVGSRTEQLIQILKLEQIVQLGVYIGDFSQKCPCWDYCVLGLLKSSLTELMINDLKTDYIIQNLLLRCFCGKLFNVSNCSFSLLMYWQVR